MSHLHVGGTVVIASSGDPSAIVDAIVRHQCNYTSIAAPLLDGFCDAVVHRPEALATLTTVLHGGSAAPPDRLRRVTEVLGDRFVEGWGMTEHSGALATATTKMDVTGFSGSTGDVFASVGRAVPEALVRVVDELGTDLPRDGVSVGELVIKSPALANGYWADPVATAESFREGWYFTGDLAAMDQEGYVYLSDRRSDLIVSGGMNVYPSEVEQVISRLPGIAEVAVVGAPHDKWGQTVVAVVVLTSEAERPDENAIIAHCKGEMASFKKPTEVMFVDRLPRTASEKVRRQVVRDMVDELIQARTTL